MLILVSGECVLESVDDCWQSISLTSALFNGGYSSLCSVSTFVVASNVYDDFVMRESVTVSSFISRLSAGSVVFSSETNK